MRGGGGVVVVIRGYFVLKSADITEGARRFLLGKRSMSLDSWITLGVVWCRLVSELRKVALNFLPVRVYLAV